ncbi:hypothetical protein D3C86_2074080 [compost metagenome]
MKTESKHFQNNIDEEDLSSERFDPKNQKFYVYTITFASGKKLVGNTVHLELRGKYY